MSTASSTQPVALPRRALPWVASDQARLHKRRCMMLPRPSEAEVARLIEEFHHRGGAVTKVPPAYALATTAAESAVSHAGEL